jgi:hypothetical protein
MRSTAFAINIFLIHVLGDIWSPIAIGALADATGNLTAGMLLTVVAIGGAGVLFLSGMRYLEQDQRAALSWGHDTLPERDKPS